MKGSKWVRCLKAPVRVLTSVRDLYIKGMKGCAGRVQHNAGTLAYPSFARGNYGYSFDHSARSSASGEDLSELIRAASVRKMQVRSQSVVVGRIDEEEEFEGDGIVGSGLLFPRSRSYAVGVKGSASVFA
ncbi:uncharacterized protein A4U43_C07F30620 [Asparagus officinalis]|uniref:Uncharacterized protein n=1 Tax=Asparagus officinalis TaxID=4686 RepID=A0A5P1EJ83_ASPOF|nr:uncharacterized protein A4U43_C07F30620 [Asparagus officinalis]